MAAKKNPHKKDLHSLASAIASGRTVRSWANDNQVSHKSAYTWAKSPECQKIVANIRRKAIDRVVGVLTRRALGAVNRVVDLGKDAISETVRLQANRAILSELISVTEFADLERRLADLERRAHEQATDRTH